MKTFKIEHLNPNTDIDQISAWDSLFANDKRYSSIKQFILENNTYYGLGEVIATNYEIYPIGEDERKYALTIRDDDNNIAGFILAIVCDLQTKNPEPTGSGF